MTTAISLNTDANVYQIRVYDFIPIHELISVVNACKAFLFILHIGINKYIYFIMPRYK